jgi:DNA-binding NarL/FixJ family response regulator
MPDETALTVLLVDHDAQEVARVRELLAGQRREPPLRVESVGRLAGALHRLGRHDVDALLVALNLPDAPGLQAVERLAAAAPFTPVVVMAASSDEELGLLAVKRGAEDALVKGTVDGAHIDRALRYSIERKRAEQSLARVASVMAGLCYDCGRKIVPDRPRHAAGN